MSDNYFEYEAWLHFTLNDVCEVWELEGDRMFDLLEKHKPDLYEAFCAHKANKEIEEFISTRKRDEDYYND